MFGIDFYPTPPDVIDMMIDIPIRGKTILEPSAGRGDIVDYLLAQGVKNVLAAEIDPSLRTILKTKSELVAIDFLELTGERISHIDAIIMNPPFSRAAEHILHAWTIAPPGTQIRALLNMATIKNAHTQARTGLKEIIEENGSVVSLGNVFNKADRPTEVEVGLVRLKKPGESATQEFEGFFMDEDIEAQSNGLMPYNVVRDVVNRYVEAVKIFDLQLEQGVRLNRILKGFYGHELGLQVTQEGRAKSKNEFKKDLQRDAWKYIFNKLDLSKHTTRGVMNDINKFIEQQSSIPFTMRNIYWMLQIVMGTTGSRMDKALLEVFEKLISLSWNEENKFYPDGRWKTNSHYLVNETFIIPRMAEADRWHKGNKIQQSYGGYWDYIEDLVKALCFITGDKYESFGTLSNTIRYEYKIRTADTVKYATVREFNSIGSLAIEKELYEKGIAFKTEQFLPEYGQWFSWAYFEVKAFKKGTMHFRFKDKEIWAKFNKHIARIKGYPLFEHKPKGAREQQRTNKEQQAYKDQTILFSIKQEAV